jgi:Zn-dependent peptidase ImmA (M78 family)
MLPKTVLVKHVRYKVILVDGPMEYQGRKIRGLCHKDDKVIEVSRKQTPRMILSTFWHELLHAIEHEHRITMKHSLIHELEEPLADVFLKNPQMRRLAKLWRPRKAS